MLSRSKIGAADLSPHRVDAGIWLKHLREGAGLSQRELANILALDYYTFISQLENGRGKIPSNRYGEWADALNIERKIFVQQILKSYEPHAYEILFGEAAG